MLTAAICVPSVARDICSFLGLQVPETLSSLSSSPFKLQPKAASTHLCQIGLPKAMGGESFLDILESVGCTWGTAASLIESSKPTRTCSRSQGSDHHADGLRSERRPPAMERATISTEQPKDDKADAPVPPLLPFDAGTRGQGALQSNVLWPRRPDLRLMHFHSPQYLPHTTRADIEAVFKGVQGLSELSLLEALRQNKAKLAAMDTYIRNRWISRQKAKMAKFLEV
jgi:hypothetical protein